MLSICRNTIKKTIVHRFLIQVLIRIGGYGGLHHCLIPQPKHILINRDENGIIATEVFSEQQTSDDVLKILGYDKKIK
jgi:hypothetical protein